MDVQTLLTLLVEAISIGFTALLITDFVLGLPVPSQQRQEATQFQVQVTRGCSRNIHAEATRRGTVRLASPRASYRLARLELPLTAEYPVLEKSRCTATAINQGTQEISFRKED